MNIQFSNIRSSVSYFFNDQMLGFLSEQDQRIGKIALAIITILTAAVAVGYLLHRFCKSDKTAEATNGIVDEITKTETSKKAVLAQPEIISDEWGKITLKINGENKQFKDVIILPSSGDAQHAKEWNWKWDQEGMHHKPGIRFSDVDQLILSHEQKPDVVILSQGRGHGGKRDNPGSGILEAVPGLKEHILNQGVSEVHILKTPQAIEKYTEIRNQGQKSVAALIHTTC